LLAAALREANRAVYLAARGSERRGMGCTAEAVYVDGRHIVIGHVGDSRVYRLHRGDLTQLTLPEAASGADPDNIVRYEYDERRLPFRTIRARVTSEGSLPRLLPLARVG
jgi:serine/threonine protein phosphatase PrpC